MRDHAKFSPNKNYRFIHSMVSVGESNIIVGDSNDFLVLLIVTFCFTDIFCSNMSITDIATIMASPHMEAPHEIPHF